MQEEVVIAHNNQDIHGTLYTFNPKTLLVISPGYLVTRKNRLFRRLMKEVRPGGPSMYVYDSLEYITKPLHKRLLPSYEKKAKELETIVNYFIKSKTYDHVILEGVSLGALLAVVITPRIKGLDGLILINGFFDLYGYLRRYWLFNFICKVFYKNLVVQDLTFFDTQLHPEKITVPTLVLHGNKDTYLDPEASKKIYERLGSKKKEFEYIPEGDHFFRKPGTFINAGQIVIEWMKRQKLL